ncbi:MAG: hypothetical protein WBG92_11395 [Thiohalocapsa sp.]
MINVWRIALICVAGFLAWRIVATGLGAYYVDRMKAGDESALQQVLTWQPEHPFAQLALGIRLMSEDPERAQALLARAYRANPTDPRPLIILASQFAAADDTTRANELMDTAASLAPVDPRIQEQVAAYWADRGDAQRALSHLSKVMEAAPAERRRFHPTLLKLAADPVARGLLGPYALLPPPWWESFFKYAAHKAVTLEPVRFLYNVRRDAEATPLTDDERAAYVGRLQRDGLVSEAYLVWINGLDASERQQLGLIYNGGFELELSNEGFGWRVATHKRVDIRSQATYGAVAERSLKLDFRALENRFRHLSQPLFLNSGIYRLSGKARADSLLTKGGLQWQVNCLLPESHRLGESKRFLGSSEWADFEFDFEVPASCESQELRLVSSGTRSFELKIDGNLWFDDMRIGRISVL